MCLKQTEDYAMPYFELLQQNNLSPVVANIC